MATTWDGEREDANRFSILPDFSKSSADSAVGPNADAGAVSQRVLSDLFSLAANPAVELCQLLDAILDWAIDLTSSDAGGAICVWDPESQGTCWRLKSAGTTPRGSQATLAQELASQADSLAAAASAGGGPRYFYCREASEAGHDRALFRRSRSFVALPLLRGEPASGLLRIESDRPHAYSHQQLRALSGLHRYASLLIERQLLKEHARAAGLDIHPVGMSPRFLQLESLVKQIAYDPSSSVLIRGERGSGKDLAAYAVHYFSRRRSQPYVAANCAAFTNGLASDELFGHERGSFTGADRVRGGIFQSAHGGSLFFDEIGDMEPGVQASLLRALDLGEIRHIGSDQLLKVDVRIIAATNQNLEQLVEQGRFRSDLYDRLNVFEIHVPPLRERVEDVRLLADFFLKKACAKNGRHLRMSDQGACQGCAHAVGAGCTHAAFYEALSGYDFPGNVRELRNLIYRVAATVGDELHSTHLGSVAGVNGKGMNGKGMNGKSSGAADLRLDSVIRNHIETVLEKTGGNKSAAARILGKPLTTMINKMKKLEMA